MKRSIRLRAVYLLAAVILLGIEIIIALYFKGTFIRYYVGDVLVIPLLCCLMRVIFPEKLRLLGIYMIAVGVLTEVLQFIGIDRILGLEGTVSGVIVGSTFDFGDIICYVIGGLLFFGAETLLKKGLTKRNSKL